MSNRNTAFGLFQRALVNAQQGKVRLSDDQLARAARLECPLENAARKDAQAAALANVCRNWRAPR
jgi:hypothetical protein